MSEVSARANIRIGIRLPLEFDRKVYTLLTGEPTSNKRGRPLATLQNNISRQQAEKVMEEMIRSITAERRMTMSPEIMAIALLVRAEGSTVLNERWAENVRRKLFMIRKASREEGKDQENDDNYVADITRYYRRVFG